jgi:very-short-patch-repair endonuclease
VGAVAEARKLGLGPLVEAVMTGVVPLAQAEQTLERSVRQGWWDAWLATQPTLARFRGTHHADLVGRFRALDLQSATTARQLTLAQLASRLPDLHGPGDQLALLKRQLQLKARHMPLRRLFREAGDVLRALKPCVLMSPLSVAKYLDPEHQGFDVVVFDEASQIPPWDAVGAIARGTQVIVVGDSRQLPPTSFFEAAESEEEPDDEQIEELESILDEAVAAGLHQLRLRWHYRSRHESLIAFSNHHYYDNRLHTFPSADQGAAGRGVELVPVPEGYYDRGRSRTNRGEAEATVAELLRLLRLPEGERPTVGVVTFSTPQQRLIEDLLDEAIANLPELQHLLSDQAEEPVFIKNLESVQGDERDVMLFSIGYGPDRAGKVTMSFGPLNRQGGERRLNVAITRARQRLVVFSTLRHDQIDLARSSAVGVAHLKSFLQYAEQGVGALDAALTVRDRLQFDSPFEAWVHAWLTSQGHEVHTQIGCSGYRIDLAVVDPQRPGAYLLAVECDGAAYHSSRNARERDRLREEVLRGLGWKVHRVWSTDWWYERDHAQQRLLEAIDNARRAPSGHPVPKVPTAPIAAAPARPSFDERLEAPAEVRWPPGCVPWPGLPELNPGAREQFELPTSTRQLAEQLRRVVQAAGPLPRAEAYRHVGLAWGFKSSGKRITARLDAALATTDVQVLDEVLWPAGVSPANWVVFRYANGRDDRDALSIPAIEVANAVVFTVGRGVAMQREALYRGAAQVFGLTRLGSRVEAAMEVGLGLALEAGRVVVEDGTLRLPR